MAKNKKEHEVVQLLDTGVSVRQLFAKVFGKDIKYVSHQYHNSRHLNTALEDESFKTVAHWFVVGAGLMVVYRKRGGFLAYSCMADSPLGGQLQSAKQLEPSATVKHIVRLGGTSAITPDEAFAKTYGTDAVKFTVKKGAAEWLGDTQVNVDVQYILVKKAGVITALMQVDEARAYWRDELWNIQGVIEKIVEGGQVCLSVDDVNMMKAVALGKRL